MPFHYTILTVTYNLPATPLSLLKPCCQDHSCFVLFFPFRISAFTWETLIPTCILHLIPTLLSSSTNANNLFLLSMWVSHFHNPDLDLTIIYNLSKQKNSLKSFLLGFQPPVLPDFLFNCLSYRHSSGSWRLLVYWFLYFFPFTQILPSISCLFIQQRGHGP